MANLTDADKVLRNDTGKDIVTQLTAIKTAIENGGGGGGGASTVSQLTDVLLSSEIPDGDVLVRDNNLTGGKLWKNATITVELTQAEYNQLVADDEVLPDVDYYITDAPSMQGTSADLSYDGTTKSTYTKIEEIDTELSGKADISAVKELTSLSQSFTISANSSITIQANSSRIMCLLFGVSDSQYVASIAYLIGGYVTASRCIVTNLSGLTGVTINASSTTDMKFVINNTQNFSVSFSIYNLIGSGFTKV